MDIINMTHPTMTNPTIKLGKLAINKRILFTILFLLAGMLTYILVSVSPLERQSDDINDFVYQQGDIPSGTISIIQIDEHSLEELGPYNTWTRDYVAEAIERLNANPEIAPAAIGVDVLYIGHSNEESDAHLVEATGLSNNVVYGSYLNIDTVMLEDAEGSYYMGDAVTLYERPFTELREKSTVGFVNGFADTDGIMRHAKQSVILEDTITDDGELLSEEIPSFSYAVYKKYITHVMSTSEVSLDIPTNSDGYWYIDYTDRSDGYSSGFSLSDFIQGEIPVEYFTDGIVLIGPYAEGLMDSYHTSIDKNNSTYGVEIHANLIESMLRGDFKRELSRTLQALIAAVIAALAVLMCYKDKLWMSIVYLCACVIGWPLICILLYRNGIVVDIIYVPIITAVITIINIIRHYISAANEKRRVERTFKRYVAPEVVDEITKTGMDTIKLGGEAVECAILFVDIRGFTTMSEALEPEEVVSILNKYLELTSSSIFKYNGTLDKFIGDATMAIFGAPLPQEDYIYNAVCAAWNMVKCAKAMSAELEEKYGRSVSFGVGVNCGKAVVGNIGTERRMDYTAIGDTVNTAARLEANAPKDTVYISKPVYDALEGRIEAESIGNLPLKGKSEQLEVFRLVDVHGFK